MASRSESHSGRNSESPLENLEKSSLKNMENSTLIQTFLQGMSGNLESSAKLSQIMHPSALWTLKMSLIAGCCGLAIGGYRAASKSSLIHLAENAHRLPVTKGGWFMYHKQKNHRITRSFIQSGLIAGIKWGFGVASFCLLEWAGEELIDGATRAIDYQSELNQNQMNDLNDSGTTIKTSLKTIFPSTFAGFFSGILFASYNKLWRSQSKRAILLSTSVGVAIGCLELLHLQIYNRSIKKVMLPPPSQ